VKPLAGAMTLFALVACALAADAGTHTRPAARAVTGTAHDVRHAGGPQAGAVAAPHAGAAGRTLEDIHIEGEIAVPQVLFITARDQRRFMEFQNRRYLRTSSQLGQATVMPNWILVTPTPITAGKEIAR
jgi:hypothetical protein